jgi:hypothetical protein
VKKILFFLVILIGSPFLFYVLIHPTHNWHQKTIVEIETPDGLKTGSSVVSVRWKEGSRIGGYFPGTEKANSSFSGEATVVEVLPGKYLFALLKGETHLGDPEVVALGMFGVDGTIRHAVPILKNSRQKEDIPRDHYPLLVTFKDLNDPASVQQVEPDQLATIFGLDIKLKRITLEITDEPVTRGKVEKVLGWFSKYRKNNYRLNGETCVACPVSSENIADLISTSEFKIGD